MEFFTPGRQFDFMKQRKYWIALSVLLSLASLFLLFVPGPVYGTDFRGGTEVEIAFKKPVESVQLHEMITTKGFSSPEVIRVVDPYHPYRFLIRTQDVLILDEATKQAVQRALCFSEESDTSLVEAQRCPLFARATEIKFSLGGDKITARYEVPPALDTVRQQLAKISQITLRKGLDNPRVVNPRDNRIEIQLQSKGDQLMEQLYASLGEDTVPERALRMEWVGPKAGKQLRDSARNAVALSIVFIMVYLVFRFDLRFAPGVVLACVHDAMVVLGVFVALRKEITLSTIAAILTIVGYSMNDTVVVYDRIRENLGKYRNKSFADIINQSVSETLSRTLLTSGATLLSVLAFFVWGTGMIKDFAFAMVIGIVAGTYSSIYVAAPLTEWIDSQRVQRKTKQSTLPLENVATL